MEVRGTKTQKKRCNWRKGSREEKKLNHGGNTVKECRKHQKKPGGEAEKS